MRGFPIAGESKDSDASRARRLRRASVARRRALVALARPRRRGDRLARPRQAAARRLAQRAPTSWRCGSPTETSSPRSPGCRRTRATPTWRPRPPRLPANHGLAEEALAYRPDLVLVGPFTDPATVALLKQVGAPVVEVGVPRTLDGVRRQIRDVAAALGERGRGEALVADMDARLARVAVDPRRPRLRAIVLEPERLHRRAGLAGRRDPGARRPDNLAAGSTSPPISRFRSKSLALLDADVLILDRDEFAAPSLADARRWTTRSSPRWRGG